MEIHKPKPWHNPREFIGEVGIIVLGVLIALAAEQIVQRLEWRHKIHAAEEAMRIELGTDDGPQAYYRAIVHPCVQKALKAIAEAAGHSAPRAALIRKIDSYRMPFWTWDSFAYNGMIASGVAGQMTPARSNEWSIAYGTMAALDRTNEREYHDQFELFSSFNDMAAGPLTAVERQQVMAAAMRLYADDAVIDSGIHVMMSSFEAVGVKLTAAQKAKELGDARAIYGDCAQPFAIEKVVMPRSR